MRNILVAFSFLLVSPCFSQIKIQPGEGNFENKWITDKTWKMDMKMVANGATQELGVIQNDWRKDGEVLEVITQVVIPGLPPRSWIDSLTVDMKTLEPIRHKSVNMQRDILINYGDSIQGFYLDKKSNVKTPFSYAVGNPIFDSGFYLTLFQLLELKPSDSTVEMEIFDFKPEGKQGVLKAFLTGVESGYYSSKSGENIEVWIVKSYDTIGNQNQTVSYISKSTRDLLKQEMLDPQGNGMILELIVE